MTDKEIIQKGKYGLYIDWDLDGHFQNITTSTKGYKALTELYKQLKHKEQECEELRKEYQQLQERFNIVYDDLMYMNVYQCKKCGHYTMKDYVCHICGTDPTEDRGNNDR